MEIEPIKPPFTHERVWGWCARAGELAVEEHLSGEDHTRLWHNADLRKHARAWVRKQQWGRERAAEASAKSAGQAAWFSAIAAMISAALAAVAIGLALLH
jgi:DNA-binding transcriptional LysR family regulator